ncbi:STAS domain-containing protein [Anaerolineales bacterium HSG6]|nr:STAS domain-containing protein [Anaerolineales bacterium HSG6]MDM8532329.1 STAS domain-containing protein [Anaerolineales bacterium HSG25]
MNDNDKTKEQLLQELQETREQLKNKLRVSEEQYRNLEKMVAERTTELSQNVMRLEALFMAFPDLYFYFESDGTIVDYQTGVDKNDSDLYAPPELFLGKNVAEILPPDIGQQFITAITQIGETGKPTNVEYMLPMGNEDKYYEARCSALPNGQIFSVVRNVTDQENMRQEQKRLQQEIIEAQQHAIQELSVPIIPVMDRIIVMPLIGSIDSMRASDIMRTLLAGITEHRAKVVILDITGVAVVDTGVAAYLDKIIQAARLKGARTIVTGISDAVAETIIDLGIDWSNVETLRDLQTGLMVALHSLGFSLKKQQENSFYV